MEFSYKHKQDIVKVVCFGFVRPHYNMTWNTPFSILSCLPISNVSNDKSNTFWVASRLVVYKFIQIHNILKWLATNEVYFPSADNISKWRNLRIDRTTNLLIHPNTLEYISKPKLCHAPEAMDAGDQDRNRKTRAPQLQWKLTCKLEKCNFPKNHWTLQCKGLNLYSTGWGSSK